MPSSEPGSVDVAVMTAFIAVVVTKRHDAPL